MKKNFNMRVGLVLALLSASCSLGLGQTQDVRRNGGGGGGSGGAPSGSAGGDLGSTYPNPSVSQVGGVTAANVASGATAANNATTNATGGTIVKRDAAGGTTISTARLGGVTFSSDNGGGINFVCTNDTAAGYTADGVVSALNKNPRGSGSGWGAQYVGNELVNQYGETGTLLDTDSQGRPLYLYDQFGIDMLFVGEDAPRAVMNGKALIVFDAPHAFVIGANGVDGGANGVQGLLYYSNKVTYFSQFQDDTNKINPSDVGYLYSLKIEHNPSHPNVTTGSNLFVGGFLYNGTTTAQPLTDVAGLRGDAFDTSINLNVQNAVLVGTNFSARQLGVAAFNTGSSFGLGANGGNNSGVYYFGGNPLLHFDGTSAIRVEVDEPIQPVTANTSSVGGPTLPFGHAYFKSNSISGNLTLSYAGAGILETDGGGNVTSVATVPNANLPSAAMVVKTANYTIQATDHVVILTNTSGTIKATLPAAATVAHQQFYLVNSGAATVIVTNGNGTDLFNYQTKSLTNTVPMSFIPLYSDGTNFFAAGYSNGIPIMPYTNLDALYVEDLHVANGILPGSGGTGWTNVFPGTIFVWNGTNLPDPVALSSSFSLSGSPGDTNRVLSIAPVFSIDTNILVTNSVLTDLLDFNLPTNGQFVATYNLTIQGESNNRASFINGSVVCASTPAGAMIISTNNQVTNLNKFCFWSNLWIPSGNDLRFKVTGMTNQYTWIHVKGDGYFDTNGAPPPPTPPPAGPTPDNAWWKFAEGAGHSTSADQTSGGHAITLVNSPTWGTDNAGFANFGDVILDGTSQYLSYSGSVLPGNGSPINFSIVVWVKFSGSPAGTVVGSDAFGGLRLDVSSGGNITFSTDATGFSAASTGGTLANDNHWHMIGFTEDSIGDYVIYIDGVNLTHAQHNSGWLGGGHYIGADLDGGANNFLNAAVADVAVYTTTLTDANMTTLYAAKPRH